MADPFIGEIRLWGPTFAPRNWAFCEGQIVAVAGNPALFSILGTTYGGDGRTTFGLPDLRGRGATHAGQGAGLTNHRVGDQLGSAEVPLNTNQVPAHSHPVPTSVDPATHVDPTGRTLAAQDSAAFAAPVAGQSVGSTNSTGGGQPHNNLPPYLSLRFIICLNGIFPSRN